MRTVLLVSALVAVILGVVLWSRRADASQGDYLTPPPPPPLPYGWAAAHPAPIIPGTMDPRAQKTGGFGPIDLCKRAFGLNSQAIGEVPNKNAQYVKVANDTVGAINCGTLALLEKGASTIIVTPAKAIGHLISSIF